MKIVGIDPGKTGGLAMLVGKKLTNMTVMPEDSIFVRDLLIEWKPDVVYLEKAQSAASGGVSSMFNYGQGYGEIIGILKTLKIPHTLVRPAIWCKVMHQGLSRNDTAKQRSFQAAFQTFPKEHFLAGPRCKKPHDGLMDAALIAEYARQEEYAKGNH